MEHVKRTIFHVDMDSFFASCEQQADPRLRGKPIAVSGDPKSRTVVAAASKEAKKWGVKSGMTIRDARALCPHIQFVLGDPDKYVDVSRRVMTILRSYTEDMEIFSIDEAFLDVMHTNFQYPISNFQCTEDPVVHLALDMKRRIRAEVGEYVTCSIGIASNKRLAKLGSDYCKPNGITVVTDDARLPAVGLAKAGMHDGYSRLPVRSFRAKAGITDDARLLGRGPDLHPKPSPLNPKSSSPSFLIFLTPSALLSSLKLRDLCGIGARIEARLHDLGIWTVSGLAAAPLDLLTREFGVYGVELHDMAHGRDTSPVVAGDAPPKSVGHAATLPRDIHTMDEAHPVIAELAEKVAARLRRYGFRGSTVHFTVRYGSPPHLEGEVEGVSHRFSGFSEQRSINAPTDDGLLIAREAMGIIEVWCRGGFYTLPDGRQGVKPCPTLPHPFRLLGISVSALTPRNPWQQQIFPKSQRWTAATQALDAVNDRYGDWTLQRATLLRPVHYLRKAAAAFRATRHLRDER